MRADFDWPKADRRNEFLRARINAGGGLELFPNQGSGVLTSTVWGDGLIDNPPGQAIARGDMVRFIPFAVTALRTVTMNINCDFLPACARPSAASA
jgi:molybdopterin molybdotransferase